MVINPSFLITNEEIEKIGMEIAIEYEKNQCE